MKRNGTLTLCLFLLGCVMQLAVAQPANDIVGVASGNKDFSTLVTAIKAAGLVNDLKQPGPFTVFAPTNQAFNKLPRGTLASLLKPENKAKLRAILMYHVVSGRVTSADIRKMKTPMSVKSLQGGSIRVTRSGSNVMVGNARVVKPDVQASNGIIHVIDTVIMPPSTR